MPNAFDPYHRWLAIPPKDQPPNLYRLLGLDIFESDLDVVAAAADRQMSYVKAHEAGEHAELSQLILNEIATARVCLLNPERKALYDASLADGRELIPDGTNVSGGDALELGEQPADDPPFSAVILDAGEPEPEEWERRIRDLAGLHESLSGKGIDAEPGRPEVERASPGYDEGEPERSAAVTQSDSTPSPVVEPTLVQRPPLTGSKPDRSESQTATEGTPCKAVEPKIIARSALPGSQVGGSEPKTVTEVKSSPAVEPKTSATSTSSGSQPDVHGAQTAFTPMFFILLTSMVVFFIMFAFLAGGNNDAGDHIASDTPPKSSEVLEPSTLERLVVLPESDGYQEPPRSERAIESPVATRKAKALIDEGMKRCGEKDLDDAIARFDEAIDLNPLLPEAYYCRGLAWSAKAEEVRTERSMPGDDKPYSRWTAEAGWQRFESKREYRAQMTRRYSDRAIADFDRTIQLDPSYTPAYTNRDLARGLKYNQTPATTSYRNGQGLANRRPAQPGATMQYEAELKYYRNRAAAKEAVSGGTAKRTAYSDDDGLP